MCEKLKVHPIFLILKKETDEVIFDSYIKKHLSDNKMTELPVFMQLKPNGENRLLTKRKNSISYKDIKVKITEHYNKVFSKCNGELASKLEFVSTTESWFIDYDELVNQANIIDQSEGILKFVQKMFFICPVALILSDKSKEYATKHFIGWNAKAAIFIYESNNDTLTKEEKEIYEFQKLVEETTKYKRISLDAWDNIISLWFYILQSLDTSEVNMYLLSEVKEEKTY